MPGTSDQARPLARAAYQLTGYLAGLFLFTDILLAFILFSLTPSFSLDLMTTALASLVCAIVLYSYYRSVAYCLEDLRRGLPKSDAGNLVTAIMRYILHEKRRGSGNYLGTLITFVVLFVGVIYGYIYAIRHWELAAGAQLAIILGVVFGYVTIRELMSRRTTPGE